MKEKAATKFELFQREKRLNLKNDTIEVIEMKDQYDLSTMKSRKNPYASKLKKPVTMRLSEDVIDYFKNMSEENGVPYQSLINLYLRDCVTQHRKIDISWHAEA
ncbi:MAG: antitoxin [Alteromonadaceae bacterium]|nr:antitoxin [Alteromonadaceae bacterium]